MSAKLTVRRETWPLRQTFKISRGSKTQAEVVIAEIEQGDVVARGECVPYAHYGETLASVVAQIESFGKALAQGKLEDTLHRDLSPGAARNALDCALWDLRAKTTGKRVWELANLPMPSPVETVFTLSMESPEVMHEAAKANAARPALKLKLGGSEDIERVAAVRSGAPDAKIVVDANEGWSTSDYDRLLPALEAHGVSMIEQPFPASEDAVLSRLERPIAVCADEACHDRRSLDAMIGKYDMANIKLDKTGGLTEALALRDAAKDAGFGIMVGCMVGTSLAMAPGLIVAQGAEVVDLDGPLLLARDREPGLVYETGGVHPPETALWG